MSKGTGNPTQDNVQYQPKNGSPVGKPCNYRYHETRRKDNPGQTTIHNRCKMAAPRSDKKCAYPGKSHKDCPRLM